ncbi:MAG TPA: hypothetical protein VF789_05930 [Thermoanaerobaculia bacterium]
MRKKILLLALALTALFGALASAPASADHRCGWVCSAPGCCNYCCIEWPCALPICD